MPLVDEVQGRSDDEGRAALQVDGHEGDVGLTGSGREDDDPASAGLLPSLERAGLKGARLRAALQPVADLRAPQCAPGTFREPLRAR